MEARFNSEMQETAQCFQGRLLNVLGTWRKGAWVCMRVRVDKSTPNEYKTYRKVFESIIGNITEEDLLKQIKEIVSLPMYADRIRNDSKPQIHHHQQGGRRK